MKEKLLKDIDNLKRDFKNKNYKKQVANMLTATRLLSPFILIPLIYFDKLLLAVIMVIIFSLTDTFDGYFARKYKAVSYLGKYLDAVVDKVFALSLLIPIVLKITANYDFLLINVILEVIIGVINLYAFFSNLDPYSTIYGKIKTTFLFSLIGILYLNKLIEIPEIILFLSIIVTIVLQIITIISYFMQIKRRKTLLTSS